MSAAIVSNTLKRAVNKVDVRGNNVDVRGTEVDVRGNNVDSLYCIYALHWSRVATVFRREAGTCDARPTSAIYVERHCDSARKRHERFERRDALRIFLLRDRLPLPQDTRDMPRAMPDDSPTPCVGSNAISLTCPVELAADRSMPDHSPTPC
eukprot:1890045-Pyramimonas_sp.AAC.1